MSTVAALAEAAEGGVPFQGHTTWYRVVGRKEDAARPPLLCLHGGLSIRHDYLLPLEAIATTGTSGDLLRPAGMWALVAADQLPLVGRRFRRGDRRDPRRSRARAHPPVRPLGGGPAGAAYALTRPAGLASLTLASSAASIQQLLDHQLALVEEIEPGAGERLLALTDAERTDDPYYRRIVEELFERRMTRIHPWRAYSPGLPGHGS